ncbi:unnamed protein product [Linum tenue]|uniref:Zinc-ribbon domain-containing protein n=1 Tax=Linum tenue TaxID=586396 RepID=A0AAV0JJ50_9ROSI|nr:unnamed protein product [Linum tenue]
MAEGSKARLVRCPKCNNLLTELPNFSVYKCGSCAAVLRAKKNPRETDGDSFDKLERLSAKEGGIAMNPYAANAKPIFSWEKDRVFRQGPSYPSNKSSMVDQSQPAIDNYTNRRMMMMKEKQNGFHDFAPRRVIDESSSYQNTRLMGGGVNRGECSTSSSYGYGRVRKEEYDPLDRATSTTRISYLEHDRAELLRKVDELKQQLNQVCDSSSTSLKHNVMIPSPYHQSHAPRGYFSSDLSRDQRFESHPHGNLYHKQQQQQPAAHSSCACCSKNFHVCSSEPQQYGSDFSYDTRSVGVPPPSPGYSVATSRDPQIQSRWLAAVAKGNNRRLLRRPIACGAPFITCCACFELLELPRKTRMKEKDRVKLRCGACSEVLMLELRSKKLMVSVCEEMKEMDVKAVDGSCELSNDVHENVANVCEVQTTGLQGSIQAEEEQILNIVERDKRKGYASSSGSSSSSSFCSPSDSSDEEESIKEIAVPQHVSCAIDLAVKDGESPAMSTMHDGQENLGGSKEEALNLEPEGNINTHTRDQANDASRKDASSMAAAVPEVEEEFSFSDYRNMDSSLDSIEMSNAKASPIHRLAGVFKKSFKDFAKPLSPQPAKKNKPLVFVNGQPIHEDSLRMAEKLAGPIHPGDYWYDFRAGFWGVMGQPCLGVIPAFIEEFNYPMPRNCAAGNTGVFVNGRELHQQDMELLSKRGLPTLKHKFYTLEIDGRLYDNDSRKELGGLGKLAPTVEKVKRGFGMKVPRFVE